MPRRPKNTDGIENVDTIHVNIPKWLNEATAQTAKRFGTTKTALFIEGLTNTIARYNNFEQNVVTNLNDESV